MEQQQDYLKRQIDQLGRVLSKILADFIGHKSQGKVNEGIEITDQTLKNKLDLGIDELIAIPKNKLIETLTEKNKLYTEHLEKLADLVFELAEGFDYQGQNKKAIDFLRKDTNTL